MGFFLVCSMTKIAILQHLHNGSCVHFQLKDHLHWLVSRPLNSGSLAEDQDLLLLWFLCLERFLKQGSDFNWEDQERLEVCGELLLHFRSAKGVSPTNSDYLSVKAAQNWEETSKTFNPETDSLLKVPKLPKTPLHSLSTEKLKELFSYVQLNNSRYTVDHLRTNFDDFWSDFETSDQKEEVLQQYFPIRPNLQQSCLLPFSQTPELYKKMKARQFFGILMQQLAKPILSHLESLLSKNEPDRIIIVVQTLLILAFHSATSNRSHRARDFILKNLRAKLFHCLLYPLVYDKLHHYFKNLKDDMDAISQYSPLGSTEKEYNWEIFSSTVKECIEPNKWKQHTIDPGEEISNKDIRGGLVFIEIVEEKKYNFDHDVIDRKWIRIIQVTKNITSKVLPGKPLGRYTYSYLKDDSIHIRPPQVSSISHPEFGTLQSEFIDTENRAKIRFTFPRKLEPGEIFRFTYTHRKKQVVKTLEENLKPNIISRIINKGCAMFTLLVIYPEWYPLNLITVQNGEFVTTKDKLFFHLRSKDQPRDEDGNIINKYYSTDEHAEHVAQHSSLYIWIEDGKRKVELKVWADKKTGFIRPGTYGIAHAKVTEDELNKAYQDWQQKNY